jgi:hypothetical protein
MNTCLTTPAHTNYPCSELKSLNTIWNIRWCQSKLVPEMPVIFNQMTRLTTQEDSINIQTPRNSSCLREYQYLLFYSWNDLISPTEGPLWAWDSI